MALTKIVLCLPGKWRESNLRIPARTFASTFEEISQGQTRKFVHFIGITFAQYRIKNFREGNSLVFNMFHQIKLFVVVRFCLQESLNILKIKANYTACTIWQSVTSMWWQAQWTVGMKNTLTGPGKWNQDKCLIRPALNVSCRKNWNMRTIVVLIDICNIGQQSTDTQPIVRPYSARCRSSIRRRSADCRVTIGRFTSGWLILCYFPFLLNGRCLCFGFSTLKRKSLNLQLSILKITVLTILTIQNTIKHNKTHVLY